MSIGAPGVDGIPLIGGRYDGYCFRGDDGWVPPATVRVLYIGTLPPTVLKEANRGFPIPVTTAAQMPFKAADRHDPFDAKLHGSEVYLRGHDGIFRTPKMHTACSK